MMPRPGEKLSVRLRERGIQDREENKGRKTHPQGREVPGTVSR